MSWNLDMGTTFGHDVIDKSHNVTINAEHGRSLGC